MRHERKPRGSSYPLDIPRRARELRLPPHRLPPSEIVRRLALEYPEHRPGINTVKKWIGSIKLTPSSQDGDLWEFTTATPEQLRVVAQLFALEEEETYPVSLDPADRWPTQRYVDWALRLRQLDPTLPLIQIDGWARYLAAMHRSIEGFESAGEDASELKRDYLVVLAHLLIEAGLRHPPEEDGRSMLKAAQARWQEEQEAFREQFEARHRPPNAKRARGGAGLGDGSGGRTPSRTPNGVS